MTKISFSNNHTAFSIQLRKKIDEYFTSQNIKLTGNRKLYMKTIVLMASAGLLYSLLVFMTLPAWVSLILCVLMGFNLAAIGFNVMHDGAHGSYSQKKWVNEMMSYSLDLLGGCSYLWKVKHNVNHHSFTNIDGADDDIDIQPWIRTTRTQPRKWYHKYQHVYWVFFYSLTYVSWVFGRDFQKYFSGKVAGMKFKKMSLKDHLIFWGGKLVYTFLFIVLPVMMLGFIPTLVGYLVTAAVCGLTLSIVFQLAHVIEEATFPELNAETKKMTQDWTIHQLATTANFSTRNKALSWFVGGLNFQVEHHLFPRISHIHYPAINKMVKDVCAQFNVRYLEHRSFFSALRSHIMHLKVVGAVA